MAIDKSLRWQYGNAEREVDPFSKGFETIAGKGADVKAGKGADIKDTTKKETDTLTSGLVAKAKDIDFGTIAQQAIFNKVAPVALSKLGLGALNPYLGLISLLGNLFKKKFAPDSTLMQKFAPDSTSFTSFLNPFGTQEAWEANQEAEALGRRKDYMWDRMLKDKTYSEKNLIDVINKIAKKEGYHDAMDMEMNLTKKHIPEAPEVQSPFAKVVPKTPEVITPHGPDETAPDVTKDFGFEDATAAAQQAATQQAAAKQAAATAAAKQAVDRHRGEGGPGGYGGGPPGGEGGWKGAKGGYVDRPLPGRNRYL